MARRQRRSAIYEDIAAEIRAQILSGEIAPGQPLGSEADLAHEHGVSATTIGFAINALRREGLVEPAVSGRRATVAERPARQEVIWPVDTLVIGRPATVAEAHQYADDGIHVGTLVFVVEQGETVHLYRQDVTAIRFR